MYYQLVTADLELNSPRNFRLKIMFGSRARGDAEPDSDMDVLVVLSGSNNATVRRYVNDCAWEAGFDHGLVVSPVVVERQSWVNGPERYSLLAKAIEDEGITI
jgi:predicted nucleotidyltransferase